MKLFILIFIFLNSTFASVGLAAKQELNTTAIILFILFVLCTLGITYFSSKQTHTTTDFYIAGGEITGLQNGLAIAGDYMSAASFLGISGLIFLKGYDGLIYAVGFLIGWPIILFILAERLRNLGKYTFADIAAIRLQEKPIRLLAACGSITVVLLYLIAQLVGSGKLIELLFGLPYQVAVILVGILMMTYVSQGGMRATTWVQIIKAILLLSGVSFLALAILSNYSFNLEELFTEAVNMHVDGEKILAPGNFITDPISAISLGLALMFGTAGLPHILMRFFTVTDTKEARRSVVYATGFIGYFYIIISIIGLGAIAILAQTPEYLNQDNTLIGGDNMAAIHLSHALGGNLFLGFISAVAFATILAVVSGLTLAGASAVSHDIYANVIKDGCVSEKQELKITKLATIGIGILSILLGISFEEQNIAYMVGLAFAIAASANFPILILSIYWKNLTTKGALIGGYAGLLSAIAFVITGPIVWTEILQNETPIFPYKHPALFSMTIAFTFIWIFSITDKSTLAKREKKLFEFKEVTAQTGLKL